MRLDRQAVLADKSLLLLDFDGPVCSVFAGYPAPTVAAELVERVRGFSPRLAAELGGETDPMRVLRAAAEALPKHTVDRIDEFLCRAELRAIDTATPTPGTPDLIEAARRDGKTVGIVSNNCPRAIAEHLRRTGLDAHISLVVARPYGRPRRMKPDPYLLIRALSSTGTDPARACFIGDSVTDIEAGRAVGVTTIGYANRPGKA
ncbi:HAD family hydrolase, partial [Glycomyces tenuis]